MSKIVLFGSGRGADVAMRFLRRDSEHEVCGFAVDREHIRGDRFNDLPVVPFDEVEQTFPPDEYAMFVLLGYQELNSLRARKYHEAKAKGYRCISYVNSHFYRAEELNVGDNCFILDNQSISLDVRIGNNVVMWSSNHIGDLTVIEDDVWIASHVTIAAGATIGAGSMLGVGATVGNNVKLGPRTFVGANALVVSDTPADSVCLTGTTEDLGIPSTAFLRVMMAQGQL